MGNNDLGLFGENNTAILVWRWLCHRTLFDSVVGASPPTAPFLKFSPQKGDRNVK
jgi:hypothetical protein